MSSYLKYLFLTSVLLELCESAVHGTSIGIPEPTVMLRKAEVVGVASLRNQSGQWSINFSRVLKGEQKPGTWIPLAGSSHMDLDFFGKMVDSQPFLFLGVNDRETHALFPAFWMVSAWPQGKPRDSRLETLEGSVRFAEAVLAEEIPKGENTMAENAVLPPVLSEEKLKEFRADQDLVAAQAIESRRMPSKTDIRPKASTAVDQDAPKENPSTEISQGLPIAGESKMAVSAYAGFVLASVFAFLLVLFFLKRR